MGSPVSLIPNRWLLNGRDCRCADALALMEIWGLEKSIRNASRLSKLLRVTERELLEVLQGRQPEQSGDRSEGQA